MEGFLPYKYGHRFTKIFRFRFNGVLIFGRFSHCRVENFAGYPDPIASRKETLSIGLIELLNLSLLVRCKIELAQAILGGF